jgi:exopolysaccharide biosynthesis protein
MDNLKYRDFISAYPPLVEGGRKSVITFAEEINYKARRSLFGYNKTHIYLIVIDSPGMNFREMQDLCLSLGIEYAINLDGGGSSSMVHQGITITDTTNRQVDNVLAVYLKKEEPKKTIYRV